MIKTLIVDDEKLARQLIRSLLSEIKDIEVIAEAANGSTAIQLIKEKKPDLIFLDIQMPGMSGFQMLDRLRPDQIPYVIFVTAFNQYAIKAFELHALDYLLKPFEKERLHESIDRARTLIQKETLLGLTQKILNVARAFPDKGVVNSSLSLEENPSSSTQITIREGKRIFSLQSGKIVWIKAENQYVRVHTLSGYHLFPQSLTSFHKKLDPRTFYRIHRSAIVNVHFIKEITTDKYGTYAIILSTGERLKLSRGKRSILKDILKYSSRSG